MLNQIQMKKAKQISLFEGDESFREIRKQSGLVQMSNMATLLQRKIMDVSIWFSRNQLKTDPNQRRFGSELGVFKNIVGFKDGNNEDLKEAFREVRRNEYDYNIFHKDSSDWGNLSFFSDVQIIVNGR